MEAAAKEEFSFDRLGAGGGGKNPFCFKIGFPCASARRTGSEDARSFYERVLYKMSLGVPPHCLPDQNQVETSIHICFRARNKMNLWKDELELKKGLALSLLLQDLFKISFSFSFNVPEACLAPFPKQENPRCCNSSSRFTNRCLQPVSHSELPSEHSYRALGYRRAIYDLFGESQEK